MKAKILAGAVMALLATTPGVSAQTRQPQQPVRPAQPAPAPTPPAPVAAPDPNPARASGWVSRCVTSARAAVPECVVEQNVFAPNGSQPFMTMVIQIPTNTRAPVMQLQVPYGIYLPGGVQLRTDAGVGLNLVFQMCNTQGCFAGNPVSPEFLAALKSAKRLEATVQDMRRAPQLLAMPMDGFAAAYERVQ